MIEKRANIEIIAPSIEEAITKGLEDLGLPEDEINIEVLDEGSKGLFGLGNRQARVRLTVKSESQEPDPVPSIEKDRIVEEKPSSTCLKP